MESEEHGHGGRHATAIRLLVLDDCELKRLGLVAALAAEGDMLVVGEAGDSETALCVVRDDDPDVAIVDAHTSGARGMSAVRTIARGAPELPVVVVTASDGAEHLLEAVSAGVRGYLGRSASPAELRAAVRTVQQINVLFNDSIRTVQEHLLALMLSHTEEERSRKHPMPVD